MRKSNSLKLSTGFNELKLYPTIKSTNSFSTSKTSTRDFRLNILHLASRKIASIPEGKISRTNSSQHSLMLSTKLRIQSQN